MGLETLKVSGLNHTWQIEFSLLKYPTQIEIIALEIIDYILDWINEIVHYSSTSEALLLRKAITMEILRKYLRRNGVLLSAISKCSKVGEILRMLEKLSTTMCSLSRTANPNSQSNATDTSYATK